jgi:hypothetical protein
MREAHCGQLVRRRGIDYYKTAALKAISVGRNKFCVCEERLFGLENHMELPNGKCFEALL